MRLSIVYLILAATAVGAHPLNDNNGIELEARDPALIDDGGELVDEAALKIAYVDEAAALAEAQAKKNEGKRDMSQAIDIRSTTLVKRACKVKKRPKWWPFTNCGEGHGKGYEACTIYDFDKGTIKNRCCKGCKYGKL